MDLLVAQELVSAPALTLPAHPLTASQDVDLLEIMELMLEGRVGAVPVVDSEGKLLGMISSADVLRELSIWLLDAAQ